MSLPSAAELLKVQLRQVWLDAGRILDGVTEDEYFWEPAAPCWSIRRRALAVRGWGNGEFVCEDAWPPPNPLPITTIAWRVIHLAAWTDIYRVFAFESERLDLNDVEVPGDLVAGLAWFLRAQADFIEAVEELTEESAFDQRSAHWGESVPVARLVTIMLAEHVHHLAEIGVLRDLHRGNAKSDLPRQMAMGLHSAGPSRRLARGVDRCRRLPLEREHRRRPRRSRFFRRLRKARAIAHLGTLVRNGGTASGIVRGDIRSSFGSSSTLAERCANHPLYLRAAAEVDVARPPTVADVTFAGGEMPE